jgi:hypothetical protein
MDYHTKYLKYKNKYLQLKKEIHGGLRVDNMGLEPWHSTLKLPLTITNKIVVEHVNTEGRCLVVGCQCAAYESNGGKLIAMMEDPHPHDMRGHLVVPTVDKYQPKIPERECKHCKHNLGSHALKAGLNQLGQKVYFISYKDWVVEHTIKGIPTEKINKVSLYDEKSYENLKDPSSLGLDDNHETKKIINQKEGIETSLHWK